MTEYAVKLNRSFDPLALQAACGAIGQEGSVPAGYPGEGHVAWKSTCIYSRPSGASALLAKARYLQIVLDSLDVSLRLARLMVLESGGLIKEHQDSFLSHRIARLHVPVRTHRDVEFYLAGERCHWQEGELWYGDFSRPHRAVNLSDVTRLHLVLDVDVDDRLLRLFPADDLPEALAARLEGGHESVSPPALGRFAFDFVLPPGFALPGMPYQRLDAGLVGSVRPLHGELCIFINEQPLLKAVPLSEDVLDVIGLAPGTRLELVFQDQGLERVVLTMDATGLRVPLELR
jgi:aspartyl/asparaginyl beta-hydroxylase (cupin superfamily)